MSTRIALALLCALGIWIFQIIFYALAGPLRKVPGPWYARFTNLPLKWATIKGRRMYFIEALHKKYGDMVLIAPNQVDCNSPTMFREIHRHGNGFRKAAWYRKFAGYKDVEERNSLFIMEDPKTHATRRKLMARAFSKSEIRKHWEVEIKQKVEFAVRQMEKDAKEHPDGEVDVQKWWTLMAADVISRIAFGESFNLLLAGQKNEYLHAVERIAKANGISAEVPIFRLLCCVPIPSIQSLFNTMGVVMDFATKTVNNSRTQGTAGVGNIFTSILAEVEKSGSTLDDVILVREARSLIIAGTDTTAITLTFLVWNVLSRPQLHRDLLEELRREAGDMGEEDGFALEDEQLEQLPLLTAVIQESMRLYGAAPGSLPRSPPLGGATVGGVYIPDSAVVSTQAWSLHRHPAIWENPEEFDVSRWLSGNMSDEAKAAFHPWGGGGRVCLGMHVAEMELRHGAATFFLRYPQARLAPRTTPETMRPEQFFIITPKNRECGVVLA
ncbi:Cytochrome P450 [Botryosphaeria dothidea]|uniref:Cytochrome P450 n=1 Tax=Botryosphaeria dothidea TaxID=55169 RepID=A0A8H4MZB8_9PEZI|nr:Cytochrome P450 [Botryosphaeria dothidea]